jgi:hypothetical protein
MASLIKKLLFIGIFIWGSSQTLTAQDNSFLPVANPGLINITEAGQLADTLNLWGDIRISGRYLVPRGTNLTELISYAKGPQGLNSAQTWSKVKLDIYISRYNVGSSQYQNTSFGFKPNEPLPSEMRNYSLRNGDVITVKASRKPSFRDYFSVIAPVISLGLTTFLFVDRLNR